MIEIPTLPTQSFILPTHANIEYYKSDGCQLPVVCLRLSNNHCLYVRVCERMCVCVCACVFVVQQFRDFLLDVYRTDDLKATDRNC